MNRTKNNLLAILGLLFLTMLMTSATASASIFEWIYGDTLMWVAIILGCVVVLALIGLFIYSKIKGGGLSMLLGRVQ